MTLPAERGGVAISGNSTKNIKTFTSMPHFDDSVFLELSTLHQMAEMRGYDHLNRIHPV